VRADSTAITARSAPFSALRASGYTVALGRHRGAGGEVFAINGWWIALAALAVVSAVFGVLAWRTGLPLFRARDD
jgi:hypothetical protein